MDNSEIQTSNSTILNQYYSFKSGETGINYSSVFFDVKSNLSDDERYLIIPKNAVYEVKFPNLDINGVVI